MYLVTVCACHMEIKVYLLTELTDIRISCRSSGMSKITLAVNMSWSVIIYLEHSVAMSLKCNSDYVPSTKISDLYYSR